MKAKEIDALPAGREIDKLVAIHILGWKYEDEIYGWPRNENIRPIKYPHFSTKIESAWEIIDVIKDRDWRFILDRDDTGWSIEIELSGTKEGSFACGAIAQTAPLAICRAILKTVEDNK